MDGTTPYREENKRQRLRIHECRIGKIVTANVDRLYAFIPWSAAIMSTSPEVDPLAPWTQGGHVQKGELFIIPLEDSDTPIAVGKALSSEGSMIHFEFQGIANATDNVKGKLLPGWKDLLGAVYYSVMRQHAAHTPYTGEDSNTPASHAEVLVHGFKLTERGHKIPAAVLRVAARAGG